MEPFDFQIRPRIIFGKGSVDRLGELAKQLGSRCALVVSDPGVVAAGHFDTGRRSLEASGIRVHGFHDFKENPTSDMVETGVRCASRVTPDLLVGLGGGSSMDCCKGINFVYSCGGSIAEYRGIGNATGSMLPMIGIPTTSGTGSESQSFALISDAATGVKMACGDRRAACRIALLDPELTLTQPTATAALTGIDALSHALETYVTRRRNPMSLTFSRQAFSMLIAGFPKIFDRSDDLDARSEMQLGSCLAGMAIESSMLGAAHATANPLTAQYGIPHGQAVGVMLPHVIRFNGTQCAEWYAQLLADQEPDVAIDHAPDRLAHKITQLLQMASLQTRLKGLDISSQAIDRLTEDALTQWTGTFNPISLTKENIRQLYVRAL